MGTRESTHVSTELPQHLRVVQLVERRLRDDDAVHAPLPD